MHLQMMSKINASLAIASLSGGPRATIDVLSEMAGGDPDKSDDVHAARLAIVWTPEKDGAPERAEVMTWDPPCDYLPTHRPCGGHGK